MEQTINQTQLIPYYKWCYGKFILVGYLKEENYEKRK